LALWNARTALSVPGPKIPSAVTDAPRWRSSNCAVLTVMPESPSLTVGQVGGAASAGAPGASAVAMPASTATRVAVTRASKVLDMVVLPRH
jgi:hypothetical protein